MQDQIIAPLQSLYVDNINGDDTNGDGSRNKPFKTLDVLVNHIKDNIPKLYIFFRVYNDSDNIYPLSNPIIGNASTGSSNIKGYSLQYVHLETLYDDYISTNYKKAKIKPPFGRYWSGQYNSQENIFNYGNMLFIGINNISLNYMEIDFTGIDTISLGDYLNAVFVQCTNITFNDTIITLVKNSSVINSKVAIINLLSMSGQSSIKGNGWISTAVRPSAQHGYSWDGVPTGGETGSVPTGISSVITSILKTSDVSIATDITQKSNQGYSNNFGWGYKSY